jgi:hypothetical protein
MPLSLAAAPLVAEDNGGWTVRSEHYTVQIARQGFRYSIHQPDGSIIAPAHAV